MAKKQLKFKDLLDAVITGCAVADAYSLPFDGQTRDLVKIESTMTTNPKYNKAGVWGCNTLFNLSTLDALSIPNWNYNMLLRNYRLSVEENLLTCDGIKIDAYESLNLVLKNFDGYNALANSKINSSSLGAESLMRMPSVVLFLVKKGYKSDELIDEITEKMSELTHPSETVLNVCKLYVHFMLKLVETQDKYESYKFICSKYKDEFPKELNRILSGNIMNYERNEIFSGNNVVNILEASLWCLLRSDNYQDVIFKSTSLGFECNKVAFLSASMMSVLTDFVPKIWLNTLKGNVSIKQAMKKFEKCKN